MKVDGKVVSQSQFRVKYVPDPVAAIGGKFAGGTITKQEILNAGGITVVLMNFDFDLRFEVVEFALSAYSLGGFLQSEKSNSFNFTKAQIDLINSTKSGNKIYIEDIKAKAPDGTIRNLGSLTFKIE